LLGVGIKGEESLHLLDGRGLGVLLTSGHSSFAEAGDAMWINGQNLSGVMTQGVAQFSQGQLGGVCFPDGTRIEQMVYGRITGHKGQPIGHFKALLTEAAIVAFSSNAQSGFVDQLHGHPGFDITTVFAGPAAQQVPGAQAQMFGNQEPDTDEVAGDFIAEQLADLPLDAARITGLNPPCRLGPLCFERCRIAYGKGDVEFFFEGHIR